MMITLSSPLGGGLAVLWERGQAAYGGEYIIGCAPRNLRFVVTVRELFYEVCLKRQEGICT